MKIILRIVLFPLAVLYRIVTGVRNLLYDLRMRPSVSFEVPVICVGNITVGGTGKTPMIEHLIRLCSRTYKVATLSRGYGRDTKGFRLATPQDTAGTIGDEPMQFYRKFNEQITVSVCEDRAFAIPAILQEKEEINLILLDDGFQHRRVRPHFSLVLTDYYRPFYKDFLLPAGQLRESRKEVSRAHAVVVTKCPTDMQEDEMMRIEHAIRKYAELPIFFSRIHYGEPVPFGVQQTINKDIILVTGIGYSKPLYDYVIQGFRIIEHVSYADHHAYTLTDLAKLQKKVEASPGCSLVTTEKDWVKLTAPDLMETTKKLPFFFIPIEVDFVKSGEDFDAMVLAAIQQASSNA